MVRLLIPSAHPRVVAAAIAVALMAISAAAAVDDPFLWPERERSFLQDGPGWLLDGDELEKLIESSPEDRVAWIEAFLGTDPIVETELKNELVEGIDRRRRLVVQDLLSYLDERSKLLFLHGEPTLREIISCDVTFVPLEIWWYGDPEKTQGLILYEPRPDEPYRLWLPLDSKRVLYGKEMEYWLEQVAELRGYFRGPRFDRSLCKKTKLIDKVTGIDGLFGFRKNRPENADFLKVLEPPEDLAEWSRSAADTPIPDEKPRLIVDAPRVSFPELNGQRMVVRVIVTLPVDAGLEVYEENEKSQLRVKVVGVVERQGEYFDEFHMRFQVPVAKGEPQPLTLVVDRQFRPEEVYLVRMRITDEIGKATTTKAISFRVPSEAEPDAEMGKDILVAHGEDFVPERAVKEDTLFLLPPETDLVLGLWRAETLITGNRIVKAVFFVDGKAQFTRGRPPFHAEVRLSKYPTEQVIRVEGYGEDGEILAWDEVVVNQQRGRLEVRIANPKKGSEPEGDVLVRAHVVVPEEKRVEKVEFLVNDEVRATLVKPPWERMVEFPSGSSQTELDYLTIAVTLDDGTRVEDVQFLNQPEFLEEVDVDYVQLYTSVDGDENRRLVKEDFTVLEDKREQTIRKFELVEDLPITIGVALDTSGSMLETLGEAKRTAITFLDRIITPKDQSFAVSFANKPGLIMPRTSDVGAVEAALESLHAVGNTALYDAVITSLYYFRGVRGRRALILLSDGEDTASTIKYKDALEYARRSGVVIYSIGLNIPRSSVGVRGKLAELSKVTGGRSFFISKSAELDGVYASVERELRSQYLLAYLSDAPKKSEEFRVVQVKVKGRLKARTISGYYP